MQTPHLMIHAPAMTGAPPPALEVPRGATLEWVQPSAWRTEWTLHLGARPIGRLKRKGWVGWTHVAESPSGGWTLRSSWLGKLDLTPDGAAEPSARFQSGWLGNGRIWLAGGEELLWRRTGFSAFWNAVFELRNPDDSPLLRFRHRRELLRTAGTIEVQDLGHRHARLETLIVLGWGLAVLSQRHSHAH